MMLIMTKDYLYRTPVRVHLSPAEWIRTRRTTAQGVCVEKAQIQSTSKAVLWPRARSEPSDSRFITHLPPLLTKRREILGEAPSAGAVTPVLGCNKAVAVLP